MEEQQKYIEERFEGLEHDRGTYGINKEKTKIRGLNSKKRQKYNFCLSVFRLATSYSHRDKVPTTISAEKLNLRVRYGNACNLLVIVTRLFNLEVHFLKTR